MECTMCGISEGVRKFKDLPLAEGWSGYIRLAEWTPYCLPCAKEQGELFTKQMDDLLRSRQ
jgi:hypothetical protein